MAFVLKKIWWILILIAVGAGIFFYVTRDTSPKFEYTTEPVQRGTLEQTVEATGRVEPATTISLNFPAPGIITEINVAVGDQVAEGTVLAKLDDREARSKLKQAQANVEQAQANLNSILTGASSADVDVSRKTVNRSEVDYQNALSNLEAVKLQVEEDIITFQQGVNKSNEDLTSAKQSLQDTIATENQNVRKFHNSSLTSMRTALADIDIAIDEAKNTREDSSAAPHIGKKNPQTINNELISRDTQRVSLAAALIAIDKAETNKNDLNIDLALSATVISLNDTFQNLVDMFALMSATSVSLDFKDSALDILKNNITAQQSKISTDITAVQNSQQNIITARLARASRVNTAESTITSSESAISISEANLELAKASKDTKVITAENQVKTAFAGVEISKAQLNLKQAPPKYADVQSRRAQVKQLDAVVDLAMKTLDDRVLRAPISGTVTVVNLEVGEQLAVSETLAGTVVEMVSLAGFDIDVDISEADIAKVSVDDIVEITLDAFGDDELFMGHVRTVDPVETVIQEVIYYNTMIDFDIKESAVKPGMTANVTINTAQKENVLFIPRRAVIESNGERVVRILENNESKEVPVKTGLRGDNGLIEIRSGLEEGQEVITFVKELD